MRRVETVRRWLRHAGPGRTASVLGGYLAVRALGTGIRRHVAPAIGDFTASGGPIVTAAGDLLRALGFSADRVASVLAEYPAVADRLAERYAAVELYYPRTHGVEAETGAALYGLTRLLAPARVAETGVADGRSSYVILAALTRNGTGTLHSFDVNDTAGRLVGHHPQWRLTILDRRAPDRALRRELAALGPLELFFHDSDHMYLSQLFEYDEVWPHLVAGGVLASDDVDDSRAFLDFCAQRARRPAFLFDHRKIVGAARV
ncbi:class I SAM-dependent methyltransferase [Dactylosporangium sp. NPDC051541]|uniref:class I SAM-dependent methyltransferase n=1 Tax=Dactylosporangium sp. NPDC051541 TaxID=3363977 RepID=UPI0037A53072